MIVRCMLLLLLCPLLALAQTIPVERTVDWSQAGLKTPISAVAQWVNVTDFGAVTDGSADVSGAIHAAQARVEKRLSSF